MHSSRTYAPLLLFAFLLAPLMASADAVSELHITPDGTLSAKNVSVVQKAGTNLFTRATWGLAFVRVTVLIGTSTIITKNHGEAAVLGDITEGDRLDVDGPLSSGADAVIINARHVRDVALERESKTISGVVQSVNRPALTFVLPNKPFGNTTISLSASTPIKKGARSVEFGDLAIGDKVLSAQGTYDYPTNTLSAYQVEIYQDKAMFAPRTFEGTLKSLSGTALPVTLTVEVGGTDYTVYLPKQASVLNRARRPAALTRFVPGDTVRFYGAIRQTDFTEIDADTLRDVNF